jgi:UDP-N-acetylmuramate--alanine ligase
MELTIETQVPSNGMSLENVKKVHFIGIGGIGMSALARLFLHDGKIVTGSDRSISPITCGLEALGISVSKSQEQANITDDIDLVVYTAAMPEDHPELLAAREHGIRTIHYFEALGLVANQYYLIAVSGTHGKTTTTAMLTDIFEAAGFDPTAVIGSLRSKTKSNFRPGKSRYFIVEACEYKRHFHHLKPDVLIITNIEHEHVDYFSDLADVQDAFRVMAQSVSEDGAIVCASHDDAVAPVLDGVSATVIDYTKCVDPLLRLTQPGMHNQLNAAAAIAAALFVGIEASTAKKALEQFAGTWRRFEYKGEVNGAKVYVDYGHHPTEIRATLAGARELYPDKKITIVFQPHTYSRTEMFFDDFAAELGKADAVVLLPVYAARKEKESKVSSEQLVDTITASSQNAAFQPTFSAAADALKSALTSDEVVVVMGAGDVTEVADLLTA